MKKTALVLLTVSVLGFGVGATSAYAGPAAYDGYAIAYEVPVDTGRDVSAVAVSLVNSRFQHRRVAGPGVIYRRARAYWW
jgi:hypothetical protein